MAVTRANTKKRAAKSPDKPPQVGRKPQARELRNIEIWEQIRNDYIQGMERDGDIIWPTLNDLAAKYPQFTYGTIANRSSTERWRDRRNGFQVQRAQEQQRKRITELSKEAIAFDKKTLDGAKLGVNLVTARLAEIAQDMTRATARRKAAQEILDAGGAVDPKTLYSGVYYKELQGLADALQTFQQIGMRAMGTDVQKHEISGPEGAPVQHEVSVRSEMNRDDPERLTATIQALFEAGMIQELPQLDNIVDAQVIDDEDTTEGGD